MKLTELFTVEVERDGAELVSKLSVEASFRVYDDGVAMELDIGKITDMDNSFREVKESELSLKESQQLISSILKQIEKNYTTGGYIL